MNSTKVNKIKPKTEGTDVIFEPRTNLDFNRLAFVLLSANEILLSSENEDVAFSKILKSISHLLDCERSYIYQKVETTDFPNEFYMLLRKQWIKPNYHYPPTANIPNVIYINEFFKAVWNSFERNEAFQQNVSQFKDFESRDVFVRQQVNVNLTIPIFASGVLWGYLGFDKSVGESCYPDEIVQLLKIFSSSIGTLIQRTEERKISFENQRALLRAQKIAKFSYYELNLFTQSLNIQVDFLRNFGIKNPNNKYHLNELTDLLKVEEEKKFYRDLRILCTKGKRFSIDYHLINKKHRSTWLNIKGTFSFDSAGNPHVLRGTVQDITLQKRASLALKSSEANFKDLVDSMNEGLLTFDLEGKILKTNKKFAEITGKKIEDLINFDLNSIIIGENEPAEYQNFLEEIKTGIDKRIEIGIEHPKKFFSWISIFASPVFSTNGKVQSISAIVTDITDRKLTEIQNQRLAAIIENSIDLACYIDQKGEIFYINQAGKNFLNIETDVKDNLNILDFISKEARHVFENIGIPEIAEKGHYKKEMEFQSLNGQFLPVSVTFTKHSGGLFVREYISLIARDISEIKEHEQELVLKNEELQKINLELDRFVYSASHDLRAPLTSVLGLIHVIELEYPGHEVHYYLEKMTKSIHKLDGFIQDIISYSRNARLGIDVQEIDFKNTLEEVIENLRYMEHAESIKGIYNYELNNEFYSDKSRISIILSNLISNSVKYHRTTGTEDELFVQVDVKVDNGYAIIKVIDNGEGIPAEKIEKIFNMFYRVSKKSNGSGLGLYIVKEIITKLNGSIQVTSQLGVGTTFTVTIPNSVK